ncbi:MAG: hypothetical protein ACRD0J_12770 [Acidimicrobiales bacterium]
MPTALIVQAFCDTTGPGMHDWTATVIPGESPFAGIFGTGDTVVEARDALARNVWLALSSGTIHLDGLPDLGDVVVVQVLATTRKTYKVSALTDSAGDAAAS